MNVVSTSDMEALANEFVERLYGVVGKETTLAPLHEPCFAGNEWALVKDCLDSGWVSSVGSYVDQFEVDLAKACGVEHAVVLVNGTAALEIAMRVAGVEPNDEVLIPTLTFVATANAVSHVGAVPHFIDSSPTTLGIDPVRLGEYLDSSTVRTAGVVRNSQTGRRIAAIVPMHVFGHPVDMTGLAAVAQAFSLPIVGDAAEALGTTYKGRPVTALGDISALSFNGNKMITTGGGGAVVTNNSEFARRAKHLSTTAKVPHRWAYTHDEVAFNYRMPNLNAALGCAQLAQLPKFLEQHRTTARMYSRCFTDSKDMAVFPEPGDATSNFWLNAVLLTEEVASARDALLGAANDVGLHCRPVWSTLHQLEMYKSCPRMDVSVAEGLERRIINVPSSAKLAEQANDA